jgi:dsRNA-specific ribonuclease
MHSSYIHEHSGPFPVNGHVLKMLSALGSRWCRVFALEEYLERNPLASANEQSRAWADYVGYMADRLGNHLHIDEVRLLGRGEDFQSSDPDKASRAVAAVTWQVIGVMCIFQGLETVAKLARKTYAVVSAEQTPARDWYQILQTHNRPTLTWEYERSGPDHQLVFRVTVTDTRGKRGTGSGRSKSGARSAAAEDFVRRHLPVVAEAANHSGSNRRSSRRVTSYRNVGSAHDTAVEDLRTAFELPTAAAPLLTQALTHSSWTYNRQSLVNSANQRDHTGLSHLGSVVADALIAHEQAARVISSSLAPTEDDARIMTPADERLCDLSDDLRLEPGLLLGAVQNDRALRSIKAEAMQAVLSVVWKYQRQRILTRRPRPLDEWLRIPNGKPDPSTALQQMCSAIKIGYSIEYVEHGPGHDQRFACLLRFEDGPRAITLRGPFGVNKTDAKHLASAEALRVAEGSIGRGEHELGRYLLRKQIAEVDTLDPQRSVLRGWFGVSHIASADIPAFEKWAEEVEKTIGPLQAEDLARIRSYYERCLLLSRRGTLPILRSIFTETIEWLWDARNIAVIKSDSRWRSFSAVVATLVALTSSAGGSLRGVISDWYASAVAQIGVDLSSESLGDDRDDLTAAQAAALRALLDAAVRAVIGGGRLQVSVYRQDNSAYVTLTSESADMHAPLAELARLFGECVSYLTCVQIENGWLLEARYITAVMPVRLAELARALEFSADTREDLRPAAVRATDLLKLIEADNVPEKVEHLVAGRTAELFERRTLI